MQRSRKGLIYYLIATVILAVALTVLVLLYALYNVYNKAVQAYLPAATALDAWQEIRQQLPNATTCLVEIYATRAVDEMDPHVYYQSVTTFSELMAKLKRQPPLRRLSWTSYILGDDFRYAVSFLNFSLNGVVDSAKPLTLINAVNRLERLDITIYRLEDLETALASRVPPGFTLTGYVSGTLYNYGGVFAGYLSGPLNIRQDERLHCLHFYLNRTFYTLIYINYYFNSNYSYIYVFLPIDIKK